jgi:redox-sensitive bicupin YhaK (pirin superfamily)
MPINVRDLHLRGSNAVPPDLPKGHVAALVVVSGRIRVDNCQPTEEAKMVLPDRSGRGGVVGRGSDCTGSYGRADQ